MQMASALAKTVSDPSALNVKLSHTGTMVFETGASHFYAKRSIVNIVDSVEMEEDNRRSSMRLKKLAVLQDGETRFPKLADCAHFHYEFVDFGELKLTLDEDVELDTQSEQWFTINVSCNGRKWIIRRTYESLYVLDRQLHRCIYDRKYSMLPELTKDLVEEEGSLRALGKISAYFNRFSALADNMINCGPILCWMEMDNRGKRLIVPDNDAAVNIPAIGAAHAVKRYVAQSPDEISFEVGDILSIIDKPPCHESTWWRGKKEFEVGYFPSDFVELIETNKFLPPIANVSPASSKPVLHKRGKMTSFLISFFSQRPNRTTLKQTGIMKERVFGCDLGEHLLNSGQDVPLVLKCCAEVLETHGIVDGIYRLCGVASNLQKLRNEFDENRVPDLTTELYLQDIHCISSLVKMYFRELPNPLLTYQLYDKFTSAIDADSYDNKLNRLREVVRQLPPPHFRTAKFLFKHLSRMASSHSETSMHWKNLAIVWAPNLLRSKELDQASSIAALKGAGLQAVVMEFLIANVDDVFDETCQLRIQDSSSCPSLPRPKSIGLPSAGTKLISLEEAQERALGSAAVTQQKYISVGDGPEALTSMYHTVIDLPKDRKKNLRRSAISNWRSFFTRTHSMILPASNNSQGKVSDITTNVATNRSDGDSLKRIKRSENTRGSENGNDLLDGKRRSISCDVIDGSVSKSSSPKLDDASIEFDSTSFDTLRSLQSTPASEKPFQTCQDRSSQNDLVQPLRSPLPSFRRGSRVTSRPLSESSPTESERSLGLHQMPSGLSASSSFGADNLFFEENHLKTPVCSQNMQLDPDHHDRRVSLSVDHSRQSVSSFKPELFPEAMGKTNSRSHDSNFKPYSKLSAESGICGNVEKSCSSMSSDRTGQLLPDEQEFLSWKFSESMGSRDLLSELSPAISRVMPQNNYALPVGDDSVFDPDRTESPDMYESCQSLNVIIPVTCDIGSIPENIDRSIGENDEARFSSHSVVHSKQFLNLKKNQDFAKEFQERNLKTSSFRTRRNDSPLDSSVSSSRDVVDHFSSVANDEIESAEIRNDDECFLTKASRDNNFNAWQSEAIGEEKEWESSVSGRVRDFSGQDSSKCLGNLENNEDSESVNDLKFIHEKRKICSTSLDKPSNIRNGNCGSPSTVKSCFAVKSDVSVVGKKDFDVAITPSSKSPVYASECPSFPDDGVSFSKVGKKFRDHVSDRTPGSSFSRPPVPSRKSIQETTKLGNIQNSPGHVNRPDSISFQKCRNLHEQSESPSDDVFLDSFHASANQLHFDHASDRSTESLPLGFLNDKYDRSKNSSNSPVVSEKEFSSPVSFSPSSASLQSDLRSSVASSASEGSSVACDRVKSASTLGSMTDADQHQRRPQIKQKTGPPEPTSTSEFFSESESPSRVVPEDVDALSSECAVYAEILRARSSRRSDRPAVREKSNASMNSSLSSSNARPGKHSSGTSLGSFKEHKKVFEKAVLK